MAVIGIALIVLGLCLDNRRVIKAGAILFLIDVGLSMLLYTCLMGQ